MLNWHKKILSFAKIHPSLSLSIFILICYSYGFVLWNYYLLNYGFFEYNVLQTRFLSAGFTFLISVVILYILFSLHRLLFSIRELYVFIFFIILTLIWLFLFSKLFFDKLPQYVGGSKPFPSTMIGTVEQISYLSNFGIEGAENADKKSVQTTPICIIYQNNDYILFSNATKTEGIVNLRVVVIKRDNITGTQIVSNNPSSKVQCDILLNKSKTI